MNRIIKEERLSGERALFKTRDAEILHCTFHDGESPLKESKNLVVKESTFQWKYPLWYCQNVSVERCTFEVGARAGIWFTEHGKFTDCTFIAPKLFRKCRDITILNADFIAPEEMFWWNDGLKLSNVKLHGPYAFMKSKNIVADHLEIDGNYAFDGCENLELSDCRLITKDAFWNCKHVVCRNCYIEGEYFGWNSEDIELIDCVIKSHQGFCYIKNLRLNNCKLEDTDLAFEYCSELDVSLSSRVTSIKNPISGIIRCEGYDELILDDDEVDHSKTEIIVR